MDEFGQAYQVARCRKDLDLTQRIQGLLLVNQGIGERKARILRRLRFRVQLPTRELSRADPEEQTQWLGHELQAIKKLNRSAVFSSTKTKPHSPHSGKPVPCTALGQEEATELM
jgi:hypothetical protein